MIIRRARRFIYSIGCGWLLVAHQPLGAQAAPPAEGTASVVASANTFACDLYRQIASAPGDNVFFSPHGLATALAMTWAGARGDSAVQMAKVLHLDQWPAEKIAPAFGLLKNSLAESQKKSGYQLAMANSLWPQQDHPILPAYLTTVRADFGAAIFPVDYKTQAEAARQRVNAWVEDQTQKHIQNLLQAGAVTGQTRLILVNAIYFKAEWADKFSAPNNLDAPFTLTGGATKPAIFLHKKIAGARYAEIADPVAPLQILALPYQGGGLEFIALLPKAAATLPDLEKSLSAKQLENWLGQLSSDHEVDVILPKFKLNTRYDLVPVLQKLGMADAFTVRADFSGMDGARDLLISGVVHEAMVEVNEAGTEAVAASGVSMGLLAVRADPVPVFRADHPFIFLIRDTATGAILFMGRFATPTE